MANNVQNIIEITFFEKIEKIFKDDESICKLYEGNAEDTRDWWEKHIGAKWAYIEDFELQKDYCRIILVSAWSSLDPFVEYIDEKTGHTCNITFQYIDEMPNFAGYNIREGGKIIEEKDIPDMWELIKEEAEIRKKEENVVFTEELSEDEWRWEWMWDFIYDTVDPEMNNV